MTTRRKTVAWVAAAVVMAAVFATYFEPNLVLGLATQLWNCF
jgi:hypothetical protein